MNEASDVTDSDVAEAMRHYGGSFVSALGQAFRCADASNRATLKAAFPEYFTEYRALAVLKLKQQP